jgi:hypothetical protein
VSPLAFIAAGIDASAACCNAFRGRRGQACSTVFASVGRPPHNPWRAIDGAPAESLCRLPGLRGCSLIGRGVRPSRTRARVLSPLGRACTASQAVRIPPTAGQAGSGQAGYKIATNKSSSDCPHTKQLRALNGDPAGTVGSGNTAGRRNPDNEEGDEVGGLTSLQGAMNGEVVVTTSGPQKKSLQSTLKLLLCVSSSFISPPQSSFESIFCLSRRADDAAVKTAAMTDHWLRGNGVTSNPFDVPFSERKVAAVSKDGWSKTPVVQLSVLGAEGRGTTTTANLRPAARFEGQRRPRRVLRTGGH